MVSFFKEQKRYGDSRAVTFHKKQLHNVQCICIQIKSNGIIAVRSSIQDRRKNSPIVFSLAELRCSTASVRSEVTNMFDYTVGYDVQSQQWTRHTSGPDSGRRIRLMPLSTSLALSHISLRSVISSIIWFIRSLRINFLEASRWYKCTDFVTGVEDCALVKSEA
jgi:hypothetical protein